MGWIYKHKDDLTYHMTSHLRMNAVYWGLTALCIMKRREALDAEEMIEYVMSCWDDNAGTVPDLPTPPLPQPSPPPNNESLTIDPPQKKVLSEHTQDTMRTSSPH